MPYIKDKKKRDYITDGIYRILDKANDSGDIVFMFYKTLIIWVRMRKVRFFSLCMAVGICVCTLLEFYRRQVAPYEDKKIKENGDV